MSPAALAWSEFRFQRKLFWRNPNAAFFNFALPLIFLLLIASVFSSEQDELEILVPGITGMGVMATTFTALAMQLTFLREEGILKRIRGTPLPRVSYFGGIIGSSVLNAAIQVVLVVSIGHFLYDLAWPANWLELAVFTAVGVVAFASLGIAFAHAIPNFDSAPAYVNAVFLPLIFISGVFYSSDTLPRALEVLAQSLPLKHLIDGLSGAIVSGDWELTALAAVTGWALAGLFLAVRYFRWE